MPQDKNTVDFLNNIDTSPEIFKEEAPKEADDQEEAKEEKPLPFNKDPKIQRFIEKEIARKMESFKPSQEQQFRQEVKEELNLPPALVKLVGNDTPEKREALKELAAHLDSLTDKAKNSFLEEMRAQEQEQKAEDTAAVEELNAGFESIEEEYGVDLSSNPKQRAAFVEYLRKVSHKNADGEVDQFADIPAAWEEFQERSKPQQASRAKELASRGLTRSTDATTAVPAGRSWKDVDRFFSKLKANN